MPIGKGQRIIVLHCGGKDGFVEGCDLVFKSTHIDGRDYHSEMNAVVFRKWIQVRISLGVGVNRVFLGAIVK